MDNHSTIRLVVWGMVALIDTSQTKIKEIHTHHNRQVCTFHIRNKMSRILHVNKYGEEYIFLCKEATRLRKTLLGFAILQDRHKK